MPQKVPTTLHTNTVEACMAAVCPHCAAGHLAVERNREEMRWSHSIPSEAHMVVCAASNIRDLFKNALAA